MRFTVTWKTWAQNLLASLWLNASPEDRPAITAAADEIDRLLRTDPESVGESRDGGDRILFVPPLYVIFTVNEQDRLVTVLTVRRVQGR
jgi:hypothetical protein